MVASLVANPATYFLALIISVAAALPRLGQRAWRMGPAALTALVMYVVSTAIITSYHYATVPDTPLRIVWWTGSLLIVGALYVVILSFLGAGTRVLAPLILCLMVMFYGASTAEGELVRKSFWFLQYAGIAGIAFLCWLAVARDDLVGQLTWGVLFIAETVGAAQVFDCQFLHGMAWTIVEGSACAKVYGWAAAPFVPTGLTALPLVWVLFRWFRPRKP